MRFWRFRRKPSKAIRYHHEAQTRKARHYESEAFRSDARLSLFKTLINIRIFDVFSGVFCSDVVVTALEFRLWRADANVAKNGK
jgi:hypothetical protein